MQVFSIQNNNFKQPSFGMWKRNVYKPDGSLLHRNDTCLLRQDVDWEALPKFLAKKFANVEKVNTYFYGCSDGSEPDSFLIALSTKLPKELVKKFLPIKAKDIDKAAIERAKKGVVSVESWEKEYIDYYTKGKFGNYFIPLAGKMYLTSSILADNIRFDVADIKKNCKKIEKDNCLVAARNFWPYLHPRERYILADNLHKNMGKNSVLLIGSYDEESIDYDLGKILTDAGFKHASTDCAYETV